MERAVRGIVALSPAAVHFVLYFNIALRSGGDVMRYSYRFYY